MECKCGGTTLYSEHEVKTMKTAQEWYPDIKEKELPVIIMKYKCVSCGRQMLRDRVM